ncbi:MAG: hypothetical protein KJ964_13635 [Verrucomicrobia bacterium]|nr:hypothetical protein [Verrucomicrobiota bacterium]MBU1736413.1 hypothetical protein [Verrucomicrobiota bacterium]MBU1855667.1 hypothetical protein [Verrucomicrobiota bacterium]
MKSVYRPFRNLRKAQDLLLVAREFHRRPQALTLPGNPYFGELSAWVTVEARDTDLLSERGQLLFVGEHNDGQAWRLLITPHGYLRFEAGSALACESKIPLHCYLQGRQQFRLGVSINNYAWVLRNTTYAAEASAYCRVRLLIAPGKQVPLTVCGSMEKISAPLLRPVPRKIIWRDKNVPPFSGKIRGFTAYNSERFELFNNPGAHPADDVVPAIPGGGGFAARWITGDTVEVFSRPEFTQTTSYWLLLKVNDHHGRLKRLRLQPIWTGSANMTPTFFISPNGRNWRRIAPARIAMRPEGIEFEAEIALTPRQARGCYIASAIPFLDTNRREFIDWAKRNLGAQARVLGRSVQGRPVEAIIVRSGQPQMHIAIICGQHSPAETMGANVLRPLLQEARKLKLMEKVAFHLVPTLNVDCAHYGGNGLNANCRNTNRHWFHDIQPENQAVINYFDNLRAKGVKIDFALDLHAGGIFRNHILMHMTPAKDKTLPRKALAAQEAWRKLLERHAGLRRADGWGMAIVHLRATDYFMRRFGCPSFCLELSTCSYYDPEAKVSRPFEQRALELVGRGLARTIAKMLQQKVRGAVQ